MFLEIHDSVSERLTTTGHDEELINALELIAQARRSGSHLVTASRETLKELHGCSGLSRPARGVYLKLYNELPQHGSYFEFFNRRIKIIDGRDIANSHDIGGTKIIRMSVDFFSDPELLSRTRLVGEDESDIAIFDKIARTVLAMNNAAISIQYDPIPGGGQNTGRVYRQIQREGRKLCLCITDSDKEHPDDSLGIISSELQKCEDETRPFCEWTCLRTRTIENMFTTNFLWIVAGDNPDWQKAVRSIDILENSEYPDSRFYCRLVQGQSLGEVYGMYGGHNSAYWTRVAESIVYHSGDINDRCILDQPSCSDGSHCRCVIVSGTGDGFKDAIDETLVRLTPHKLAETLNERTSEYWDEIGRTIASWCCGGQRISSG